MVDSQIHCVIDNGSGYMKAGFSGEEAPKIMFPTMVGKTKVEGIYVGDEKKESIIGSEAEKKFGILDISYPIQGGTIVNWDEMERIWANTFYGELKISPEEHNLLLSESPFITRNDREKMLEMMFETFNCASTYLVAQSVLAAYSVGKSTGISIDCGHTSLNFAPIYEGFLQRHCVQHIPIAGKDINDILINLLIKNGQVIDSKMQKQSIIKAKESFCFLRHDNEDEIEKKKEEETKEWELPDKKKIMINKERFQATEVIFDPKQFGYDYPNFQELFKKTVKSIDSDLREIMLANIIFNGGTTLIKGFKSRVTQEIEQAGQDYEFKKKVHTYPEAQFMAWLGGSILTSLTNFENLWITKAEYKEEGKATIVHKKCF
jgi:actin-related protein